MVAGSSFFLGNAMNKFQYLFGKLAEENSEVAQNALKTQIFGATAHAPIPKDLGHPIVPTMYDNFKLCHMELDDEMAVIELLNEQFNFKYTPNRERIDRKKEKLEKMFQHAINLGMAQGN